MTLQCLEGVLSPISAFFSVSTSLSFSEHFLYAHGGIPGGSFEYIGNDGCWVTSKQHPEFQMRCRVHHSLLWFLCLSVFHLWATPLLHTFFLLLIMLVFLFAITLVISTKNRTSQYALARWFLYICFGSDGENQGRLVSIRSSFFSTLKKRNLSTKFCQSRYFV